ncbi:hypothetical protein [Alicyclobacillus acidiphilus]|uniref:hypothetical protein n=1 Tax=Alicyclobacillus acidiphilus TaxID=182455 RepID=UPI0008330081|nr:hypothetical protein [Alicyclobacillus acidiphilus]
MNTLHGRPSTREQILQVATRHAYGSEASVTSLWTPSPKKHKSAKGDYCTTFPTEEDLVMSMINSIIDEFAVNMVQSAEADPVETGR